MSRPKNAIPQPRRHSSGQARVTIDGHDYLLGAYGSPPADEAYRQLIAQWLVREGPFRPQAVAHDNALSIGEVLASYWTYAVAYYGFTGKNKNRGDCHNLRAIIGIVNRRYASLPAAEFGPLDLKAVIAEMVKKGWARSYVNHTIGRLKRIFKWAASEEMIPATAWHGLLAVAGLKRGRTAAVEREPVKPVSADVIEKTREHLRPAMRAMVDFALLTGCRPNEVCQLRPVDIDKGNPDCWAFRPRHHKTEHHGQKRVVLIGPRAQEAIAAHLAGCEPEEFVFSPCREEIRRLEERRAGRKSPSTPSSIARHERAEQRIRNRNPASCYGTGSMRTAIHRACAKAGIAPWGPNRLRHTRATDLREHGLDNVATILGHAKVETTQIYSEKDMKAAMELVARVG